MTLGGTHVIPGPNPSLLLAICIAYVTNASSGDIACRLPHLVQLHAVQQDAEVEGRDVVAHQHVGVQGLRGQRSSSNRFIGCQFMHQNI